MAYEQTKTGMLYLHPCCKKRWSNVWMQAKPKCVEKCSAPTWYGLAGWRRCWEERETNLKRWEVTVTLSGQTGLALLQTHHTHRHTKVYIHKVSAHTGVIKVLGDRVSLPLASQSWSRHWTLSLVLLVCSRFSSQCLVLCPAWLAAWLTGWLNVCLPVWLISRLTDNLAAFMYCLSSSFSALAFSCHACLFGWASVWSLLFMHCYLSSINISKGENRMHTSSKP